MTYEGSNRRRNGDGSISLDERLERIEYAQRGQATRLDNIESKFDRAIGAFVLIGFMEPIVLAIFMRYWHP